MSSNKPRVSDVDCDLLPALEQAFSLSQQSQPPYLQVSELCLVQVSLMSHCQYAHTHWASIHGLELIAHVLLEWTG